MSVRAGIVVTGTEVLSGQVADQNGPWVAARLLGMGVDVAHLTVCGDRPADLTAQLRFLADQGVALIVTTGGLGPTADDLTVATVAGFRGLPLVHDADLDRQITHIIDRWQQIRGGEPVADSAAFRAGIAKQAEVPASAEPIAPVGTAPGVAVPAADNYPAILVLPGPPRELQGMWDHAVSTRPVVDAIAGRAPIREEMIRTYGLSEADLASTLRAAEIAMSDFDALEISTCMRRGEVEIVTRFANHAERTYRDLAARLHDAHEKQIFSVDGSTVDDQVAKALADRSIATAESCTGGMVAARLTDRAGSSAYTMGGIVSYSNAAKAALLGVPDTLLDQYGAVSEQVAAAMAEGALAAFDTDIAVSTTGIAGPGGGTADKPVGTVCFGVAQRNRSTATVIRRFPGDRSAVRALSTTAAMHLIASTLRASR